MSIRCFVKKVDLKVAKTIEFHKAIIYYVFPINLPNGKNRLASCSEDRHFNIYDTDDLESYKVIKSCKMERGLCSGDFRFPYVIVSTRWGEVVVFKYNEDHKEEFEEFRRVKVAEGGDILFCLFFGKDWEDGFLTTCSMGKDKGELKYTKGSLFKSKEEKMESKVVYKHDDGIYSNILHLKTQKECVVVGGYQPNNLVKVNVLSETPEMHEFEKKMETRIYGIESFICQKTHEERLLCGSSHSLTFWNLEGKKYKVLTWKSSIECSLFVTNDLICIGTGKGEVLQLDLRTYELCSLAKGHKSAIYALCWVRKEGKDFRIASGSTDKNVVVYNAEGLHFSPEDSDLDERLSFLTSFEEDRNFTLKFTAKNIGLLKIFLKL